MALLEIKNLQKSYRVDGAPVRVLDIDQFTLNAGQACAVRGGSGSGKTTWLHLIAGLLLPDHGTIRLNGVEITHLNEGMRDALRAANIGYIFQSFHLLPAYTCLENVMLGMKFAGRVDRLRAEEMLRRVGLAHRFDHRPSQLSVGQQQRVAVARAVAACPALVLADEPTGNLDSANAGQVLQLIRDMCAEQKAALLLVSHDPMVLAQFGEVIDFTQLNKAQAGANVSSGGQV